MNGLTTGLKVIVKVFWVSIASETKLNLLDILIVLLN